jgi:hypothetical protein
MTQSIPLNIVTEPRRRFAPVGRCIYCGTFSNNLTKEHIVPFGLSGDALVLPKASCTTCASNTGGFEQTCLRTILGPFRLRINSPTRNPKERPSELPVHRARKGDDGSFIHTETIVVPSGQFPLSFIGLRLRRAGILDGKIASSDVNGELFARVNEEEAKKLFPTSNGKPIDQHGIRIGQIKPSTFARLIAKIGYSYAVAILGYGSFRPLVTDLILGKTDTLSHWVGGDWEIPAANPSAIQLDVKTIVAHDISFVVADVRLFPFFETPQYHVVVGRN